jgi:DNA-binding transcriptional LysR family regulator
MKSTELNLIPVFVAVYEERSLSTAATRLSISQPAVSKALKRLRDIYDDALFHRNGSGVEATPFAEDIYPAMSASLENFASTLQASCQFDAKTSTKTFSIGCLPTASFSIIPELVTLFGESAPNVKLEVQPLSMDDYESALRLHRYDLVIDKSRYAQSSLKRLPIYRESLCLVVAKNHPRIGESITDEQYLAEQHVVASAQMRGSLFTSADLPQFGQRKVLHRVAGEVEMLPIIARTCAIGIMTLSTVRQFANSFNVKILDVPFSHVDTDLNMIWHPSRTSDSAHQWLREQVIKAGKKRSKS